MDKAIASFKPIITLKAIAQMEKKKIMPLCFEDFTCATLKGG